MFTFKFAIIVLICFKHGYGEIYVSTTLFACSKSVDGFPSFDMGAFLCLQCSCEVVLCVQMITIHYIKCDFIGKLARIAHEH